MIPDISGGIVAARFIILAISLLLLTSLHSEVLAAELSPQMTPNSFASTPQDEIVKAYTYHGGLPFRVLRTNVAGRYAAVLVAGNTMSDMPTNQTYLLERFSFGWQALNPVDEKCAGSVNCRFRADAGPSGDVESVRELMDGALVPFVSVSGNYAYGEGWDEFHGTPGYCGIFRRENGAWKLLVYCHLEPLSEQCLRSLGIPLNTLHALSIAGRGVISGGPCPGEIPSAPAQTNATGSAALVCPRFESHSRNR